MNTLAWREPSSGFHRQVMPWLTMHAPIMGPYAMGRQGGFPGRVMYLSVVNREKFKSEAMNAYTETKNERKRAATAQKGSAS